MIGDYLDAPEVTEKCQTCKGRGEVPEYHDYDTEWLGCPDCQGQGTVTVQ